MVGGLEEMQDVDVGTSKWLRRSLKGEKGRTLVAIPIKLNGAWLSVDFCGVTSKSLRFDESWEGAVLHAHVNTKV
jgi:hypothetical protein